MCHYPSQCQAPQVVSIFTQFLAHSTDHNIFIDLSEDSFGGYVLFRLSLKEI